jgi:hypothetical protein
MDKNMLMEPACIVDQAANPQSYTKPALTYIGSFATLTQGSTGSFANDFNTMMPKA